MSVAIIIPVYNLWDQMTLPCLNSLAKHTTNYDTHIYLIDNASTDNTSTYAEKIGYELFSKKNFTYIKNQKNYGFAIACNQGALEAKKDNHNYLFFLNNDTLVTKNWLPPLLKALERPRVGLVGPLLLYPDNTVQHCGVVTTILGHLRHIYSHFPFNHAVIKTRKFKAITGAAFLCRTQEFFQYGCFYEEYKNGFEDIDLCYTYLKNGQSSEVTVDSIIYHHESQTPERSKEQHHNSNLLFKRNTIIRDAHLFYAQDGYIPALTKDFFDYVRLPQEQNDKYNSYIMQNYSDNLCHELLKQEPFWHDGYQILINSLVKQNKIDQAIIICMQALCLCFCEHNNELLNSLIQKTTNQNTFENLITKINENKKLLENAKQYRITDFKNYFNNSAWYEKLLATRQLTIYNFEV